MTSNLKFDMFLLFKFSLMLLVFEVFEPGKGLTGKHLTRDCFTTITFFFKWLVIDCQSYASLLVS